jgi:hypothetical protein
MTPDEINERAWKQMQVLSDEEVMNHELLPDEKFDDVWEARIRLRDMFYNELYLEMRQI